MKFRARTLAHPHHHHGERLIRNFGAPVPRGKVLFGFPRATISFPPMQACQRRTIGGGGGSVGGGGMAMAASGVARSAPVAPTAPSCPLSSFSISSSSSSSSYRTLSDHPTHPLRMGLIPFSVRRDCTARGRYWGAYRSARGGAPLTLHLLALSLSLYLSVSLSLSSFRPICFSLFFRFGESTVPSFVRARPVYFSLSRSITGVLYLFISRAFSLSLRSSAILSPILPSNYTRRDERRALYGREG